MKLIVNADDYGLSAGVNYGIMDACKEGIVRSATMMANMGGFIHGVELAKQNPELSLGIHLVLTCGRPLVTGHKTLTDADGTFLNQLVLMDRVPDEIDQEEVEREFEEQIQRVLKAGIVPTHLDSHHHVHQLPGIFEVFLKMARKYELPIRLSDRSMLPEEYQDIKTPDIFFVDFYGDTALPSCLKESLQPCIDTDQIVEVMSHPAYVDQTLLNSSSYNQQRTKELEILKGTEMKDFIKSTKIELASFKAVK